MNNLLLLYIAYASFVIMYLILAALSDCTIGTRFNWNAVWIGMHYSKYNKRTCLNLIPFVTFWVVFAGGTPPLKDKEKEC